MVGDGLMKDFGQWMRERSDWLLSSADVSLLNSFVNWMHMTGRGATALRLINDAPRQLFLPFDLDNPPWRWVNNDDTDKDEGTETGVVPS